MKIVLLVIIIFNFAPCFSQNEFDKALGELEIILKADAPIFKKGVLILENLYTGDSVVSNYENFIEAYLHSIINWKILNHTKKFDGQELNSAIFHFLKDTTKFQIKNQVISHPPFTYNHTDPAGKADWTNTFVTKLLATHTGNCKSLSYLYKILADELGAKCWLALAPGHIYIKNYSQRTGWYNTELTSGTFPNNGWIMSSGYITLDAIKNGLYMDTLSNQQAVANLAIDLALGYQRKTGIQADSFVLKCCDLTLQYHAVNPNALLLKAETMKRMYLDMPDTTSIAARQWFDQMEEIYVRLYKLGYRQMPERMYRQWLQSINVNRKKYTNQKATKAVT